MPKVSFNLWYTILRQKVMGSLSNNPNDAKIKDIQGFISEVVMVLENKPLLIRHQAPFSDWLYEYISKVLGNKFTYCRAI